MDMNGANHMHRVHDAEPDEAVFVREHEARERLEMARSSRAGVAAFETALENARRRRLHVTPGKAARGSSGVARPFFVVRDHITRECAEVYFTGLTLQCTCGETPPNPWCDHVAAVWAFTTGTTSAPALSVAGGDTRH